MNQKKIHIFKSFEEQNAYHLDQMRNTSVEDRFRQLYQMQQLTKAFHPPIEESRKIVIRKWMF